MSLQASLYIFNSLKDIYEYFHVFVIYLWYKL